MNRSAANADKGQKADSSKESASRIRPEGENERRMELDPLRGLVPGRRCRGSVCGASLESVAQGMAALPGAQRREAAMAMQRSRGNRFVQGMAGQMPAQAKMFGGHSGPKRIEKAAGQLEVLQRQADPVLKDDEDEEQVLQGKFELNAPAAAKLSQERPEPNRTGMPDRLKAGIESLSGIDMSDVRVHANSDRPAKLNALAYTQGNQIYLGPGQERHLAHEAWHAVQQKQGRVRATREMEGLGINNEPSWEYEANVMGMKAKRMVKFVNLIQAYFSNSRNITQLMEKKRQREDDEGLPKKRRARSSESKSDSESSGSEADDESSESEYTRVDFKTSSKARFARRQRRRRPKTGKGHISGAANVATLKLRRKSDSKPVYITRKNQGYITGGHCYHSEEMLKRSIEQEFPPSEYDVEGLYTERSPCDRPGHNCAGTSVPEMVSEKQDVSFSVVYGRETQDDTTVKFIHEEPSAGENSSESEYSEYYESDFDPLSGKLIDRHKRESDDESSEL